MLSDKEAVSAQLKTHSSTIREWVHGQLPHPGTAPRQFLWLARHRFNMPRRQLLKPSAVHQDNIICYPVQWIRWHLTALVWITRIIISGPLPAPCYGDIKFSRICQFHLWLKHHCYALRLPFVDNFAFFSGPCRSVRQRWTSPKPDRSQFTRLTASCSEAISRWPHCNDCYHNFSRLLLFLLFKALDHFLGSFLEDSEVPEPQGQASDLLRVQCAVDLSKT